MSQFIYNYYHAPIISEELNERFADFWAGSIVSGFRVVPGTNQREVSLVKGNDILNVLLTWNGVRVVETADLADIVTVNPNGTGTDRLDSIYLVYMHGEPVLPAQYAVVMGDAVGNSAPTMSPVTHTLIGHVRVPAGGAALTPDCFVSRETGLASLTVGGNATFKANTHFVGLATFDGGIHLNGAASNLIVDGTTTLTGDATLTGKATFSSLATFDAGMDVNGLAHLKNTLTVEQLGTFKAGIHVTGNATFDNDVTVTGHLAVPHPQLPTDAVNKEYADALVDGRLPKDAVRVTTTGADLTLSGTQTLDGVNLAVNDRVLVKDQTNAAQNGIFVVQDTAWVRAADADNVNPDGIAEVRAGMYCWVTEGALNGDSGWILTTNNPITLDTTPLTFVLFASAGQTIAGEGLSKTGNKLAVVPATPTTLGGVKNGDGVAIDASGVLTADIGDGLVFDGTASPDKKFVVSLDLGLIFTGAAPIKKISPDFTAAGGDAGTDTTVARGGHLHDTRYFTQTQLSSTGATPGAALLGTQSITNLTGNDVQTILEALESAAMKKTANSDLNFTILRNASSQGIKWAGISEGVSDFHAIYVEEYANADSTRLVFYSSKDGNQDYTVFRGESAGVAHDILAIQYSNIIAYQTLNAQANVNVAQLLTVTGQATLNGGLQVAGLADLQNDLHVTGATVLTGLATFNGGFDVAASGTATFHGALDAKAAATFETSLTLSGTATLAVGGAAAFSNVSTFTGKATLNGGLDVNGAATFANAVTLGAGSNLAVGGTTALTGDATLTGKMTVAGLATFNGGVTLGAASDLSVGRNLTVNGTSNLVGDVTASGSISEGGTALANKYAPIVHTHDDKDIRDTSSYSSQFNAVTQSYEKVQYKRTDGTLYAQSVVSNLDTSNNYQTLTLTYYDAAGTAVVATRIWTLSYDANGNATSKVLS